MEEWLLPINRWKNRGLEIGNRQKWTPASCHPASFFCSILHPNQALLWCLENLLVILSEKWYILPFCSGLWWGVPLGTVHLRAFSCFICIQQMFTGLYFVLSSGVSAGGHRYGAPGSPSPSLNASVHLTEHSLLHLCHQTVSFLA